MQWIYTKDLVDYQDSIEQMKRYVDSRTEKIWGLQHYPVYTAGRSAHISDLLNSQDIPVYETERGGKYTYHGPGQLVVYCMISLSRYQNDIRLFVQMIELWIQRSLFTLGCQTERHEGRNGLWIENRKIAALGIRISKGMSYHGFSINVENDLTPFEGIVPCGLKGSFVTSLQKENINETCQTVWDSLCQNFK